MKSVITLSQAGHSFQETCTDLSWGAVIPEGCRKLAGGKAARPPPPVSNPNESARRGGGDMRPCSLPQRGNVIQPRVDSPVRHSFNDGGSPTARIYPGSIDENPSTLKVVEPSCFRSSRGDEAHISKEAFNAVPAAAVVEDFLAQPAPC
jgi:hypothetical protein